METVKATLVGVAPLLMHNGRLADPTNKFTKEIKKVATKRKKTEEDFLELKRLEWRGSLLEDDDGNIAMPADYILALVIAGAKKHKRGQDAKAGVYEAKPFFPFIHAGPKGIDELWEDGRFCDYRGVKVQQARTMRARPIFRTWSVPVELLVDPEIMNPGDAIEALKMGGERCGLGDFRPRYGRFVVEKN
jgi:hypothetical protein